MGSHKVHLLGVGMIGAHVWQVRGVLVQGGLRGVGLQGLGNPMEVKLVGIALPMHLGHDVFVVVVAEGTAEFIIVHVGLALPLPPAPSHLVWVCHLELPIGAFPGDTVGVGAVRQEFEQELPQLDLATT